MQSRLETLDFDRYLTLAEKAATAVAVAANEAFTAAMTRAVTRGREQATAGTFVDLTPPIMAKRLRGILSFSGCGSPAAMCMEAGGAPNGAETMK